MRLCCACPVVGGARIGSVESLTFRRAGRWAARWSASGCGLAAGERSQQVGAGRAFATGHPCLAPWKAAAARPGRGWAVERGSRAPLAGRPMPCTSRRWRLPPSGCSSALDKPTDPGRWERWWAVWCPPPKPHAGSCARLWKSGPAAGQLLGLRFGGRCALPPRLRAKLSWRHPLAPAPAMSRTLIGTRGRFPAPAVQAPWSETFTVDATYWAALLPTAAPDSPSPTTPPALRFQPGLGPLKSLQTVGTSHCHRCYHEVSAPIVEDADDPGKNLVKL